MTDIRVSEETKTKLALIKEKKHLPSLDSVISTFLNDETENSDLAAAEINGSTKVPTEKPMRELQIYKGACLFRSSRRRDGSYNCAIDFMKTGRLHVVTSEECQRCWNSSKHVPLNP